METFTADVLDCDPKGARPGLDIYLPAAIADRYGMTHGMQLELVLDQDGAWRGTVGRSPKSRVYLHRSWKRRDAKLSLAAHLRGLGLGHRAQLDMGIEAKTCLVLHLLGVRSPGTPR